MNYHNARANRRGRKSSYARDSAIRNGKCIGRLLRQDSLNPLFARRTSCRRLSQSKTNRSRREDVRCVRTRTERTRGASVVRVYAAGGKDCQVLPRVA